MKVGGGPALEFRGLNSPSGQLEVIISPKRYARAATMLLVVPVVIDTHITLLKEWSKNLADQYYEDALDFFQAKETGMRGRFGESCGGMWQLPARVVLTGEMHGGQIRTHAFSRG